VNCRSPKGLHLLITNVAACSSPISDGYCCAGIRHECVRSIIRVFSNPYSSHYHGTRGRCRYLGYLQVFRIRNNIFGLASRRCARNNLKIAILVHIAG
jgi:hypothetical protein